MILVLNCGSSSVKYQLIDTTLEAMERNADRTLARGSIDRIGTTTAQHSYRPEGGAKVSVTAEILEHRDAIAMLLKTLLDPEKGVIQKVEEIGAVGHRIVHGGERFAKSMLIDAKVVRQIEDCSELAPLHNPHNLRGYRAAVQVLPDVPHAAVFDTAFHQTLPQRAFLYALPAVLYKRHGIRRYGFHGTSHRYVAWRAVSLLGRPKEQLRLVTCHLGNGASLAAIEGGRSIDTSMGFTPLEGLVMGTRCGDLDPSLVLYLMHKEQINDHQATTMLNKHSGLYGLSGISNDMAELLAEEAKGNERAALAIDVFCYRLRKYIASYVGVLGGADAVIFTGGIGENAPAIRKRAVEKLDFMGITIDDAKNAAGVGSEAEISSDGSRCKVLVVPTNEELIIARDTLRLIERVL
jgi:acetate kinase